MNDFVKNNPIVRLVRLAVEVLSDALDMLSDVLDVSFSINANQSNVSAGDGVDVIWGSGDEAPSLSVIVRGVINVKLLEGFEFAKEASTV